MILVGSVLLAHAMLPLERPCHQHVVDDLLEVAPQAISSLSVTRIGATQPTCHQGTDQPFLPQVTTPPDSDRRRDHGSDAIIFATRE
jgi:hypothetical protein